MIINSSMYTVNTGEGRLNIDTIYEILLRLPVKSLVRLSCVCKSWRRLITSCEVFARSHLNRANTNNVLMYSITYYGGQVEEYFLNNDLPSTNDRFMKPRKSTQLPNPLYLGLNFKVVGCCDGIVCYYKLNSRAIYLWNPALHQCRTILSRGEWTFSYSNDFVGFGYDPRNKDYKVVKVSLRKVSKVELYNLRRNSWKLITVGSSCNGDIHNVVKYFINDHPLNLKGSMHWIGKIPSHEYVVVVFHVCDEKLSFYKIPGLASTTGSPACLGVFKGCLSFIATANGSEWEVWSMKVYGVSESWMRATVIDLELIYYYGPIEFSAANEELILLQRPHSVMSYDLESKTYTKILDLVGSGTGYCHCFRANYVESLISVMPSLPSEPDPDPSLSYASAPSKQKPSPSEPSPSQPLLSKQPTSEPLPSKQGINKFYCYLLVLFMSQIILFSFIWFI